MDKTIGILKKNYHLVGSHRNFFTPLLYSMLYIKVTTKNFSRFRILQDYYNFRATSILHFLFLCFENLCSRGIPNDCGRTHKDIDIGSAWIFWGSGLLQIRKYNSMTPSIPNPKTFWIYIYSFATYLDIQYVQINRKTMYVEKKVKMSSIHIM